MLFNSFEFLMFLPIVFIIYWFIFSINKTAQNLFLLISSYVFYSFWDWRFSFLLAFSTALDYFSGIVIDKSDTLRKKKIWMRFSIVTNIGLLCYFKYLNFFLDSFIQFFNYLGFHLDPLTLNILLPIGISFYTFHGVSYVLDIYYGRIRAHENFIDYSLFVSYFPLLVAGPIERATHLLPQLKNKREFKYSQGVEGCRLILWGLIKKVVIADSLAPIVNDIFENFGDYNSIELIIGLIGFAFQVYGDFSGYSDIARGVSKLFGIELILNFNFPFFSKSIPEFWSKWHISLSSWLNDYVFTPLALNFRQFGKHGLFLSVFITFLISGLWHGADWHFVFYGAFFGILYIPSIYGKKGIKSLIKKKSDETTIRDIASILLTFTLVCVGFLLFRAKDLTQVYSYVVKLILGLIQNQKQWFELPHGKMVFVYIVPLIVLDWYGSKSNFVMNINRLKTMNFIIYVIISLLIIHYLDLFGGVTIDFIYFQF